VNLQKNQANNSILVVSAEPSSNLYAQRMMEEVKSRGLDINFWGIGNQKMLDLGLDAVGRAEDMAVMGLVEVLKHYKDIKKIYNRVLERVDQEKPKVAILMDYAEFNLKLAKDLHKRNVKVVFYIAPQIWAWRRGRVKQVKQFVDRLLCIFPFEEKFYNENNVQTEFVGHPLLDELSEDLLDQDAKKTKKQKLGIHADSKVLAIMPGSRRSEIEMNLRTQIDAAKLLKQNHPEVELVLLVAPNLQMDYLRSFLKDDDPQILMLQDGPFKMLQAADFALVASGTATLVTGLMQVPMLVMYKMKPLTAFLMKKLISKNNPFFAMINLIFGKEVVPERFQEEAEAEKLAALLQERFLNTEEYQKTKDELAKLPSLLGDKGATKRLVDHLESYL
jgi:lipid-A-disaccharide synthase